MTRDKDKTQRERLYKWESQFAHSTGRGFKNLAGPRHWIKWACKQYKVKVPRVLKQRKGVQFSCYAPLNNTIYLIPNHYNVWVSLHEAAHAIVETKFGEVGHGKRFAGVLIYLLEKSGYAPKAALYASAKAAKVPFIKTGWVAPRAASRRRRKSKVR